MNKAEASKQMEVLKSEMKKLQDIIDKPEKALHVSVSDGMLYIDYGEHAVGLIEEDGTCTFLSMPSLIDTYEQWRADGMPICSDAVEWRGKKYAIEVGGILKCDTIVGWYIYDFDKCQAEVNCMDDNIKRHKHNNKPILF